MTSITHLIPKSLRKYKSEINLILFLIFVIGVFLIFIPLQLSSDANAAASNIKDPCYGKLDIPAIKEIGWTRLDKQAKETLNNFSSQQVIDDHDFDRGGIDIALLIIKIQELEEKVRKLEEQK